MQIYYFAILLHRRPKARSEYTGTLVALLSKSKVKPSAKISLGLKQFDSQFASAFQFLSLFTACATDREFIWFGKCEENAEIVVVGGMLWWPMAEI